MEGNRKVNIWILGVLKEGEQKNLGFIADVYSNHSLTTNN